MGLLKVVHLLGVVLWAGSLLIVSLLARQSFRQPREARGPILAMLRRAQLGVGLPGLVVAALGGVGLIVMQPQLMHTGWLHAKLGVVLVLAGLDYWLMATLAKFREAEGNPAVPLVIHILAGFGVIGALGAVFLMRG